MALLILFHNAAQSLASLAAVAALLWYDRQKGEMIFKASQLLVFRFVLYRWHY
jgi:hypothetical protein